MHKCNIVLSGGGMRGSAHIGVLKGLFEKGLHPAGISAVSAGAFIGAFICDGFYPDEISDIIIKHAPELRLNLRHWKQGLMDFSGVREVLGKNLRHSRIEDLQIPLHISATDLNTGLQKFFTAGDIVDAVTASSAIPLVLPPVKINGNTYADGGISNNLPYEPFTGSVYQLIGIHVNPLSPYDEQAGWRQNLERTMLLMMYDKVMQGRDHCDLFIEPPGLAQFLMFDSDHHTELIDIAYKYTIESESLAHFIAS